ncbi:MAG: hypothetical protein AAGA90_23910 [Actinomycetota bacterium]
MESTAVTTTHTAETALRNSLRTLADRAHALGNVTAEWRDSAHRGADGAASDTAVAHLVEFLSERV